MDRLLPQMRVRMDGRTGTTCPDMAGLLAVCDPTETPVVWDGMEAAAGEDTRRLEVLGPEQAVPDPKRCGAGLGAECCIFLTAGAQGFACERFSRLRWTLIFRTMNAKRHPVAPFPDCFLPMAKVGS